MKTQQTGKTTATTIVELTEAEARAITGGMKQTWTEVPTVGGGTWVPGTPTK